ncbi:MAG: pyruvate formate lyase family protein, partial [Clostridia bacterium]|nr:pyruvate formate lyase family protein [Clostridia bacterium]
MDNVIEARKALTEKPIKSTSFERVALFNRLRDAYDDEPQPIRFGYIMRDFLSEISTPLKEYDLIAGRQTDKELNAEEEAFYQEFIHDKGNLYRKVLFHTGHTTLDWESLVEKGIVGLREEAVKACEKFAADNEKRAFPEGMTAFYDGVLIFISRYASAAREKGMNELYAVLDNLTKSNPKTFREALQLCGIVTFIDCSFITENPTLGLGKMDRYLLPFYENDIKNGTLTKEEAKALITDYYCKHNLNMGRGEHQLGTE